MNHVHRHAHKAPPPARGRGWGEGVLAKSAALIAHSPLSPALSCEERGGNTRAPLTLRMARSHGTPT